tara:strand:+ start:111 stop:314 length:204 start_codon:yes stop_codon:yes gene_type:complete
MKEIFKFGDHIIAGISLTQISLRRSISVLMITLFLVHLTISCNEKMFKIGIGVGSKELSIGLQIGFY